MQNRVFQFGQIGRLRGSLVAMTGPTPLTYASALNSNRGPEDQKRSTNINNTSQITTQANSIPASTRPFTSTPQDQSSDPNFQRPKTEHAESSSYVLTFLTNSTHHQNLTALRTKYFPPKRNHLEAHLTLFHALPGSKLESEIIPSLSQKAQSTRKFSILASTPFVLGKNKGLAIGIPKSHGGDTARAIHAALQREWRPFLSDQDASAGFAPHYTIMNKVDQAQQVVGAFEELQAEFRADRGTVEGLSLWLYEGPGWKWERDFEFSG